MYLKIYDKNKKSIIQGAFSLSSDGILSQEGTPSEDLLAVRGVQSLKKNEPIFAGDILEFDLEKNNVEKEFAKRVLLGAFNFKRLPNKFDSIIVELHPAGNSMDLSVFKFKLDGDILKEEDSEDDYGIPTDGLESALRAEHFFGASIKLGEIDWNDLMFVPPLKK